MKKIFNINIISIAMIANLYFYMFEMYNSYALYGKIIVDNFYLYMLLFIILEIGMLVGTVKILKQNPLQMEESKKYITAFTKHLYILLFPWFILQIGIYHMESVKKLIWELSDYPDTLHLLISLMIIIKIYKNNWKLEYRIFNTLKRQSS